MRSSDEAEIALENCIRLLHAVEKHFPMVRRTINKSEKALKEFRADNKKYRDLLYKLYLSPELDDMQALMRLEAEVKEVLGL